MFSATKRANQPKGQKGGTSVIDPDNAFEKECEEYLLYLYELAARKYGDCDDIDEMVQDCMMTLIVREKRVWFCG